MAEKVEQMKKSQIRKTHTHNESSQIKSRYYYDECSSCWHSEERVGGLKKWMKNTSLLADGIWFDTNRLENNGQPRKRLQILRIEFIRLESVAPIEAIRARWGYGNKSRGTTSWCCDPGAVPTWTFVSTAFSFQTFDQLSVPTFYTTFLDLSRDNVGLPISQR